MLKVESSIDIARSPEEVFALAGDVDKVGLWLNGVVGSKQLTDGPLRKGTEIEHVHHFLGKTFSSRYETTEYEPMERLAFRTTSGPVELTSTTTYEEIEGGTRVHQIVEGDPRGFFKVAEPVLVRFVKRQLHGSLENLKDLLEEPKVP